MLEDIAIQYVALDEGAQRAMGFGLIIVGAVAAGILSNSKAELGRAPYFSYTALLLLIIVSVQLVWLYSIQAMIGGYLWLFVVVDVVATVVIGFFCGQIAMARSRDAFGHGRNAVLAFIPFANFVLLFKRSRSAISFGQFYGGMHVILGVVMFIMAGATSGYLRESIERQADQVSSDPASQQALLDITIRSRGLEETLRQIADGSGAPVKVDSVTTLTRVEADGAELRRTFVVNLENFSVTDSLSSKIDQSICSYPLFAPLLRAGASMREIYAKADGTVIGFHVVTNDKCAQ